MSLVAYRKALQKGGFPRHFYWCGGVVRILAADRPPGWTACRHRFESGDYLVIDETGPVGYLGLGLEFNDSRWYLPHECSYRHRSQIDRRPEILIDDVGCDWRFYLPARQ